MNFGVWNALLTGSSGLDGPEDKLHYEEDFYATLNLGFGGGFSLGTTYTAYTSPNGMFGTVQELMFKVLTQASKFANPDGPCLVAFELDGQADGGSGEGVYLELGAGPSWPLAGGKVTFAVPVKFGFSLSDYYEDPVDRRGQQVRLFPGRGALHAPVYQPDEQVRGVEPPRRGRLLRVWRYDAVLQQRGRPEGRLVVWHRRCLLILMRIRDGWAGALDRPSP